MNFNVTYQHRMKMFELIDAYPVENSSESARQKAVLNLATCVESFRDSYPQQMQDTAVDMYEALAIYGFSSNKFAKAFNAFDKARQENMAGEL